jgi:CHAT domain
VTTSRVVIVVQSDGSVVVRVNGINGAERPGTRRIGLRSLDGRLLRLFDTWIGQRDRNWDLEATRAFGQLLHRTMFVESDLWGFVRERLADAGDDVVRLMLAFPKDGPAAQLATLPWEYLHVPEDDEGSFLAVDDRVVLSRVVPKGTLVHPPEPAATTRVLPVVSDADADRLGPVDPDPVLEAMAKLGQRDDVTILEPLTEVTQDSLAAAVAAHRPHLLHFMGHGKFENGVGSVALRDHHGERLWVDEATFAQAVCRDGSAPSVVVLHTCESGQVDFDFRFAGLAPELVSAGVNAVVGMQFPVTNQTAGDFSAGLYSGLTAGLTLDVAAQKARWLLVEQAPRDYRLLGIPMIYLRSAGPLLRPRVMEEAERA